MNPQCKSEFLYLCYFVILPGREKTFNKKEVFFKYCNKMSLRFTHAKVLPWKTPSLDDTATQTLLTRIGFKFDLRVLKNTKKASQHALMQLGLY